MYATWDDPNVLWDDPFVTWGGATTLLPPSATPQERSLDLITARVEYPAVPHRTLWDADSCPPELLAWLAWAMSVDVWDPAWTDATKRQAIKDSVSVHRRKGTAGALLTSLAPYDVAVIEWQNDTPKGNPYTFVLVAGPTLTTDDAAYVIEIANRVKNARSHFSFRAKNDGGTFYMGAACSSGGIIAVTATA